MYENNSNGYNNVGNTDWNNDNQNWINGNADWNNGNADWNNGNNNWNNGNTDWNNGNTDWNNGNNNNYNGYNGYGKQKKLKGIFNGILKMLGAIVLFTSVLIIGVIIYAYSLEKMHEPRVTDDGLKGRGVTIEINGDLNDWSVLESDIYVTFKGPEVKGPKDEVSNVTIGYYIQNIRTTKENIDADFQYWLESVEPGNVMEKNTIANAERFVWNDCEGYTITLNVNNDSGRTLIVQKIIKIHDLNNNHELIIKIEGSCVEDVEDIIKSIEWEK